MTYCENKENFFFFPEIKPEYQLSSAIQQNPSSLSTEHVNQVIPENQIDDSVPKICAIFSLNESKMRQDFEIEKETEKEKEEEEDKDIVEKEMIQVGGGIFEEVAEGEDEESIEEFDPEDPALLVDEEEEEEKSLKTVYKYDMAADSYVRVEGNEGISVKSEVSQTSEGESQKEGMWQPNILKRKLIPMISNNGGEDEIQSIVEKHKVQKLDTNSLLNMNNPSEEEGIMYVTVKGSKPNEILLVKVSV